MRTLIFLVISSTAFALGNLPATSAAQAFVEQLSPPVLQRGKTTRLQVQGTKLDQTLGIWTSVPKGQVLSTTVVSNDESQATLDVQVSTDAPLGLYGLRLATRGGLSNVHIFLIDELPVTERPAVTAAGEEPPVIIALPACITARCRPTNIDRYAFEVTAGQRVSFEVIGTRFGKDFDPLITIRDAKGRLLVERDNDPGIFFDCQFAHTFAESGTYIAEVRDARFEGNPTWHYVLRMGNFPVARVAVPAAITLGKPSVLRLPQVAGSQIEQLFPANFPTGPFFFDAKPAGYDLHNWVPLYATDLPVELEQEPNHSLKDATTVCVPAVLTGVLSTPGEQDWFAFDLGPNMKVSVQADARTLGSPADLEVAAFNPTGQEIRRVDDTGTEEASFTFNTGPSGTYRLSVRDMARDGGAAFAYRVEVRTGEPQLQIESDTDAFTVPQDSFQTVPLKITRTDFTGPVQLSLLAAPPGMILEPSTIPAETNEIVCQLRATSSTPQGIYAIQILGSGKTAEGVETQCLAKTHPIIDRMLRNVDLIPYAAREEQRIVPPSLTNRLAVQVTPPAPFTLELPDQSVVLPRYLQASFRSVTTRIPGFASPIEFKAKGGQIGDESEFRNQVYGRLPPRDPRTTFTRGFVLHEKSGGQQQTPGRPDGHNHG